MINSFDTVEELFKKIKTVLSGSFPYIAVKGEISSLSYPSSGHIYFKIKDEKTSITCMCLKTNVKFLSNKLVENKKIVIVGKMNAFAKSSQLYITVHDALNPEEGTLQKSLEERKIALQEKGYFDANAKKQIPSFINTIGVITSSQGAVQHDIINRINARKPCKLVFYYSTMQGEKAENEVILGIKTLNELKTNKPELIIIARGGGSLEDLEIFNSEKIVKAVYESKLPIISAIGHETDFSFVDFTADLRASTPTAAAEIATSFTKKDLNTQVQSAKNKIHAIYTNSLQKQNLKLSYLKQNLVKDALVKLNNKTLFLTSLSSKMVSPKNYLDHNSYKLVNIKNKINKLVAQNLSNQQNMLENQSSKLNFIIKNILNNKETTLELQNAKLEKYNNKELLKKGFAIIENQNNEIVKNINSLKENQNYKITLQNGSKTIFVKPAK